MFLRNIFANVGRQRSTSSPSMTRVVKVNGRWIPYTAWKAAEEQRLAALEAEKSDRMPNSLNETYDLTFRAPKSDRSEFDFSQ